MRELLTGVTIRVGDIVADGSTTIGANVLVLATAVPAQALTVTACYLVRSDAAMAVSRLVTDAHQQQLTQHVTAPSDHHATLANACLLEHAAALRELIAERTDTPVRVDVDPDVLERAAAWGVYRPNWLAAAHPRVFKAASQPRRTPVLRPPELYHVAHERLRSDRR